MSAEDRIAAALDERAAAARPSPDALDRVFRKVAARRRRARAAGGATLALALLTGVAVAGPLGGEPRTERPAAPTPPPDPGRPADPADAVVAVGADRRVLLVSASTGAVVRELYRLPGAQDPAAPLAVTPDRSALFYSDSSCRIRRVDLATGTDTDFGHGRYAAVSPDGGRVAAVSCASDWRGSTVVTVTAVAGGAPVEIAGPLPVLPEDPPGRPTSLGWVDRDRLLVTWEREGQPALPWLLDLRTAQSWRDAREQSWDEALLAAPDDGRKVLARRGDGWAVLHHEDDGSFTSYGHEGTIRSLAVDGLGRLVYTDEAGLWVAAGDAARLVRRDVLVVAS